MKRRLLSLVVLGVAAWLAVPQDATAGSRRAVPRRWTRDVRRLRRVRSSAVRAGRCAVRAPVHDHDRHEVPLRDPDPSGPGHPLEDGPIDRGILVRRPRSGHHDPEAASDDVQVGPAGTDLPVHRVPDRHHSRETEDPVAKVRDEGRGLHLHRVPDHQRAPEAQGDRQQVRHQGRALHLHRVPDRHHSRKAQDHRQQDASRRKRPTPTPSTRPSTSPGSTR